MLRNVPQRKDDPASTGERMTGRLKIIHDHRSVLDCRKQLPPREPRKLSAVPVNHPEGFFCAWCGHFRPWSRMDGFDGRLKFCAGCVRLMDTLELSATGVFK